MHAHPLLGVDGMTASRKAGVVGVSLLTYVVTLFAAYPLIGAIGLSLSFLPVAATAWVYGARGGLVAAIMAAPLNATLLSVAGETQVFDLTLGRRGISGQMILLATALVTGFLRDRSLRLHQELEIGRLAQEQLEELIEAKDRFLASVSHELRTPLTSVFGFSGHSKAHEFLS